MNQYRMSKMFFFVISADAEKINMAINFAARRKDKGNEVRFLVFGPAEKFIAMFIFSASALITKNNIFDILY